VSIPRILEPEVMEREDEAVEYDEMDFSATDRLFAERAAELATRGAHIVDLGCGNAKIPIAIAELTAAQGAKITAVEMSTSMRAVAERNRDRAGLDSSRLEIIPGDARSIPFRDGAIGLVVSNSVIHHIPDPREVFREVGRLAGKAGAILIRDLVRPNSEAELDQLVKKHASGWSELQTRLFADSLHAALTVEEVREMLRDCGIEGVKVEQITDRHWSAERGSAEGTGERRR
jgi:ubiquinone/menaquinone biosynthesis C-methylase UbiE